MKILFLNPPFIDMYSRTVRRLAVNQSNSLFYPIWLAYAAAAAEKAGHDIRLFDAPFDGLQLQGLHREDDILGLHADFGPDMIVMETSSYSFYNDVSVAKNLKCNYPNTFIVMAGTHASADPLSILKKTKDVDAIAIGEYDYSIIELAKALKRKLSFALIDGIAFRQGDEIVQTKRRERIKQLDEIPFVSRIYKRHLNISNYSYNGSGYPSVMIITGRGCPNQCPFCVNPQLLHSRYYYSRSADNVADEFEYIRDTFPEVQEIGIEDDCFTVDKEHVRSICETLIQRKIKVKWHCNVRPDVDAAILKLMKKAGCELISVGFESASQSVLDNIKKQLQVSDYPQFMRAAKHAGLLVKGCFMFGNPGDTRQTIKESYKLAKTLDCDFIRFYPLYLYPGTESYLDARKNGYLKKDAAADWLGEDSLQGNVLQHPSLPPEELVFFSERYRKRYYYSGKYWLKRLISSGKSGYRRKRGKDKIKVYIKNTVNEFMHKSR